MYEAKAYKGLKQGSLLIPAALGGNQGNPWVFITLTTGRFIMAFDSGSGLTFASVQSNCESHPRRSSVRNLSGLTFLIGR